MDNTPSGSFEAYNKTGWINKESFIVWFKKCVQIANPSHERPVLLLLDGHCSHTKSIELINLAREKNVIMLTFPHHTTHRLQSLDVTVMSPMSTFYKQEVRKWIFNHAGRGITILKWEKCSMHHFKEQILSKLLWMGSGKQAFFYLTQMFFLNNSSLLLFQQITRCRMLRIWRPNIH